jgi:putative addiction module CopG family antidote
MQWDVPSDLEMLIQKRVASGVYANADEVLRRALEAQEVDETWTEQEKLDVSAHIEEGFRQAERGELMDATHARKELASMKDHWRASKQ